ncbi:phosphatidylglycerophosphatase A family protein [Rhodoferax antarcticus]|uniref:phosphatidylglycerophosphatase A family protein n=1 Tax=Rhodoferax antarcticus TaxID=81479 RepID=UPI003872CB2F|nr:phosphatidylglycerophosphatase A [Rhodoferax antarcticus]
MQTDSSTAQDVPYRKADAPLDPIAPTSRFMMAHPAHVLALGFGSGLSPKAPGTAGTLWAWLSFALLQNRLSDTQWGALIAVSVLLGWWACTITARHMRVMDPGSIVWDEIAAFWGVLWLASPMEFWGQAAAFALFRFFDAAKPGPVAWADQLYHGVDPATDPAAWRKAGWGIMLDDLVAAFCTLLVIALWRVWW